MLHIQKGLVIQQPCIDLRAQLLEPLHGDVVEGGDEDLFLHPAGADLIYDPLFQTIVKDLVIFQFQIQEQPGFPAEVQQLPQGPDALSGKFRGLPGADVQLQQFGIGQVPDKAGTIGGALHRGVVENDQLTVL